MNLVTVRSRNLRTFLLGGAALACVGVAIFGQTPAYPTPDNLPIPGTTKSPAPKKTNFVQRPPNAMPRVPQGFTVSLLAEGLPNGSRSIVTAPNGDLFVLGYTSNTVMLLRDGSKDGRYNTKFVYYPTGRGAPGNPTTGGFTRQTAPPTGDQPRGGRGNNFAAAQASGGRATAEPQTPARGAAAAPSGTDPWAINPTTGLPRGEKGTRDRALACRKDAPATNGSQMLNHATGMAFNGGYLYFANADSVVRYKYTPGETTAQEPPERVAILPSGGINNARNIIFNAAGTKMYVTIGSSSNDLAGDDCRRATIMEFNPDGTEGRVFASGLRNPLGLAWQPNSSVLWTTVTEREGPDYGDDLVPDFATTVQDGGFYGWPYAYIGKHYLPKYLGGQPDLVKTTLTPDVLFPAHSAPTALSFYAPATQLSKQFPVQYWGLFVALNGSTQTNTAANGNASTARGFKVVFVPFQNGKPAANSVVDFLLGFVLNDGKDGKPVTFWGRPTALAVANDGSLLVLDEADPSNANNSNSRLWKVTYNGAAPPTGP